MKLVAGNAQHIGDRQQQQDSFGFSDPGNEAFLAHGGFLGVVADGMGGLAHGSDASKTAVRTFLHEYESKAPSESIPDALSRALTAANRAVVDLAEHFGARNGTGTTLAAAVLYGDAVHWISAGDSRVYLCRRNSLIRITSDHVYARHLNEEVAKGKISRAEAEANAERAALTSFLGDLKEVDQSRQPFLVSPGDRVFVCSDGLYRALSEGELAEAFQADLQTACDALVQQVVAKQCKHQDNLTVIAFSNEAGSSRVRSTLNRTLAILIGILLLGALAGGTYTWHWWRNYHPAANTSAPANGDTMTGGQPAPVVKPDSESQGAVPPGQRLSPPKEKTDIPAKSKGKPPISNPLRGNPSAQSKSGKQQIKQNRPAAGSQEPRAQTPPHANLPAGANQTPAGSQPAQPAVAPPPEKSPAAEPAESKAGSEPSDLSAAPPGPSPKLVTPVPAQQQQNGSASGQAEAGKSSGAAPSSQANAQPADSKPPPKQQGSSQPSAPCGP